MGSLVGEEKPKGFRCLCGAMTVRSGALVLGIGSVLWRLVILSLVFYTLHVARDGHAEFYPVTIILQFFHLTASALLIASATGLLYRDGNACLPIFQMISYVIDMVVTCVFGLALLLTIIYLAVIEGGIESADFHDKSSETVYQVVEFVFSLGFVVLGVALVATVTYFCLLVWFFRVLIFYRQWIDTELRSHNKVYYVQYFDKYGAVHPPITSDKDNSIV